VHHSWLLRLAREAQKVTRLSVTDQITTIHRDMSVLISRVRLEFNFLFHPIRIQVLFKKSIRDIEEYHHACILITITIPEFSFRSQRG